MLDLENVREGATPHRTSVGPLIAVTFHGDQLPDEIDWPMMFGGVIAAGAIPVIVDCAQPVIPKRVLRMCQGLILLGGGDVDPAQYGAKGEECLMDVSPERDIAEIALIKEARQRQLPVLGICRGMQILNVALGGSLVMDIPRDRPSDVTHGPGIERIGEGAHEVSLVPQTQPGTWMQAGDRVLVNSQHHQAIDRLGEGLRVTAQADDGIIEAYESEDALLTGVQWHPELFWHASEPALQLLRGFIETCACQSRGGMTG